MEGRAVVNNVPYVDMSGLPGWGVGMPGCTLSCGHACFLVAPTICIFVKGGSC